MTIDLYGKLHKNSSLITCFMKLCAYLAVELARCSPSQELIFICSELQGVI